MKMKWILAAALALAVSAVAFAQTYPISTPTYIPNAIKASATLSAPGTYIFSNAGSGTVAIDIRGTCTSLAATVQGSVDGTNYVAMNIFPVTTGSIAASAVAAVGTWRTDAVAMTKVKVNVTALTASCTFTMVGSPQGFTATY